MQRIASDMRAGEIRRTRDLASPQGKLLASAKFLAQAGQDMQPDGRGKPNVLPASVNFCCQIIDRAASLCGDAAKFLPEGMLQRYRSAMPPQCQTMFDRARRG